MEELKPGITVAMLAYQEAENLKVLFPQIIENLKKTGEDYNIMVIDTKEPLDNTSEICMQYGALYFNQTEPGFGGAFKMAISCADHEKFLILDSDGSHNPKYIPSIHEKFVSGDYDIVLGSRYIKSGQTFDSKSSIIMSHILNGCFRLCLGIRAHDISTDYRMYDTKQLKAVSLVNRNYDVLQEVLLKMKLNNPNLSIGEVPIVFRKRIYGESKRQLLRFILCYIKSLFCLTAIRIRGKV